MCEVKKIYLQEEFRKNPCLFQETIMISQLLPTKVSDKIRKNNHLFKKKTILPYCYI